MSLDKQDSTEADDRELIKKDVVAKLKKLVTADEGYAEVKLDPTKPEEIKKAWFNLLMYEDAALLGRKDGPLQTYFDRLKTDGPGQIQVSDDGGIGDEYSPYGEFMNGLANQGGNDDYILRRGEFIEIPGENVKTHLIPSKVLPAWWNELNEQLGTIRTDDGDLKALDVLIRSLTARQLIDPLRSHFASVKP